MLQRTTAIAAGIAAALLVPAAPAAAATACKVTYNLSDDSAGFTTNIMISNIGTDWLFGWTLKFQLPAGQSLDHGWNAVFTESGGAVTGTHLSWNRDVRPETGQVDLGFRGNGPGEAGKPTAFFVNNLPCSIG